MGTKDNLRMDAKDDVELIQLAIQRLIEEKKGERNKPSGSGDSLGEVDDNDRRLLSRLLSQLESLKEENTFKPPQPPAETKEVPSSAVIKEEPIKETAAGPSDGSTEGGGSGEVGTEEIVKELRNVKRQNSITHWLLSIMIVLTATWQLSEVSLIFSVKKKLSQPFSTIGDVVTKILKGGGKDETDGEKPPSSSKKHPKGEAPSLPALKLPELPNVDLPVLGLNGEED